MSLNPIVLVIICCAIVLLGNAIFTTGFKARPDLLNSKEHFFLEQASAIRHGYSGLLAGLLFLFLFWVVNYFNWFQVGEFPATPLSPPVKAGIHSSQQHQSGCFDVGVSVELAYFTPILVSLATAGIILWNSS